MRYGDAAVQRRRCGVGSDSVVLRTSGATRSASGSQFSASSSDHTVGKVTLSHPSPAARGRAQHSSSKQQETSPLIHSS
jgi:hypothetical protein